MKYICIILFLLIGLHSISQNPAKDTLVANSINLKEVVISDSKGNQTASEVISNIDKLLRPTNSAQDLLRLVPGLFIAQHAGGGKAEQIFLRGFDCNHP